jgi:hypothetical protein
MPDLLLAAVLIGGGIVAFVVSVRLGILLGLRLDRALEARAANKEPDPAEEVSPDE